MKFLIAAFLGLAVLLSAPAQAANPAPDQDLFENVQGLWGWKNTNAAGLTCQDNPHQISISADKKVMRYVTKKPAPNLGTTRNDTEIVYTILYAEQNRITLLMNDESRRTDNGHRVVWVLILKDKNTYQWQRTDLKDTWGDVVRCSAP